MVAMAMNIKSERAHRLARELAGRTGETVTQAVTAALEERLDRLRRDQRATVEEMLAIGRRCAARLKHPPINHDELLYDERGLPK